MKTVTVLPICALALVLGACSESSTPAPKAESPVAPVTGQTALYKMYQLARTWAPDCQVVRMNSTLVPGVPEVRGKAGAWEALFVSPAKGAARPYSYSVVEGEGTLHKGAFAGIEASWSGPQGAAAKPFLPIGVKVDTDAAYKTALPKAAAWDKKDPKLRVLFVLEQTGAQTAPAWRVVWGASVATSTISVLIDATTGAFLEVIG